MKRRNQNMADLTNKRQNEIEVDFDEKTQPKCKTLWTATLGLFWVYVELLTWIRSSRHISSDSKVWSIAPNSPPLTPTTVPTKIGNKASIFSVLTGQLKGYNVS